MTASTLSQRFCTSCCLARLTSQSSVFQLTWAACPPMAHGGLGPQCQRHWRGDWSAFGARTRHRTSVCLGAAPPAQLCARRAARRGTSGSPSAAVAAEACAHLRCELCTLADPSSLPSETLVLHSQAVNAYMAVNSSSSANEWYDSPPDWGRPCFLRQAGIVHRAHLRSQLWEGLLHAGPGLPLPCFAGLHSITGELVTCHSCQHGVICRLRRPPLCGTQGGM